MGRIVVNFQHERGMLYDAADYLRLRNEFRIVGNLIGVPVSHPRNINQQGLPVVLSCCELKLLLDKNIIELIERNETLRSSPSEEQAQLYKNIVQKQKAEIQEPVVEKRMEAFRKHLPKIIEGKTNKLLKSGMKSEDININAEQLLAEEKEKLMKAKFDLLVQIPTKYPFVSESRQPHIALGDEDVSKSRVFEALWDQGGFVTVGDAFGCDFLLYPGDPMYFHASHMVHVMKSQKIDVKHLIRICRLSVVVNKFCVIAYFDECTNEVRFETVEWEGNANKSDTA